MSQSVELYIGGLLAKRSYMGALAMKFCRFCIQLLMLSLSEAYEAYLFANSPLFMIFIYHLPCVS